MKNTTTAALACAFVFIGVITYADVSSRLNITEQDGSPSTYPYKAKFSNGTVTDNGDGTVTISNTGGGGGGASSLEVMVNGVRQTSPTITVGFLAGTNVTLSPSVTGSSTTVTINASGSGTVNSWTSVYDSPYYSAATTLSSNNNFKILPSSLTLNGNAIKMTGRNMFLGYHAGGAYSSAGNESNVGVGPESCDQLTTGSGNVCIGNLSGDFTTTGVQNTYLGNAAGTDITTGSSNVCIGGNDNSSLGQSCQGVVTGSSNTMVGASAGALSTSGDSQNTYLGFAAGGSGISKSICIGYKCSVSASNTAQIGGTGNDSVRVNVSTITASSGTVTTLNVTSIKFPDGTIQVSSPTASTSSSGGGNGVIVNVASKGSVPFYSVTGSSNTLSGASSIAWDNANLSLVIGGASAVDAGALTLTGNGSQNELLHLNADNGDHNAFIDFSDATVKKGSFGLAFDGSDYFYRWRVQSTANLLTLNKNGTLNNTYGVIAGSMTVSNLASGQCVQTTTGGLLTVTGSACGSGGGGGGGASTLAIATGTAAGFSVPGSSPTAVVNLSSSAFTSTLTGSATAFVDLTAAYKRSRLGVSWDGGGGTLSAGTTYWVVVPATATITNVRMTVRPSGSFAVIVSSASTFDFTKAAPICAAACPSIVSGTILDDSTLTGWTKGLVKDGYLFFVSTSATTSTQANISVEYAKP